MGDIVIAAFARVDSQAQFDLIPKLHALLEEAKATNVQVTIFPNVVDDPVAGVIYPRQVPCDAYLPDGRSNICITCDWPDVEHILHDSDWECDECGGPSPETSSSGCQFCDGQGDIVPRGTAKRRTWRP